MALLYYITDSRLVWSKVTSFLLQLEDSCTFYLIAGKTALSSFLDEICDKNSNSQGPNVNISLRYR